MSERGWLTPDFLARLDRLRLQARGLPSARGGGRLTRQHGSSVEFAEYRPYTPGDDLRHLDWRAYGRLGKLFLKTFLDERDIVLYLWLDTSRSMAFGGKFEQGGRVAAALGYMALAGDDRVEAWQFGERLQFRSPSYAGKGATARLFDALRRMECAEGVDAGGADAVARAADDTTGGDLKWVLRGGVPKQPGLVVILSDFLYEAGYEDALRRLQMAGHQVAVLQVLAREELDPAYAGDLRLIDSESGAGRDVALSPHVLERYRQTVAAYAAGLEQFCKRRGMFYAQVAADESLEDILLRKLPHAGVIQR
jgi:uncharacterized protein (DUF58 family)